MNNYSDFFKSAKKSKGVPESRARSRDKESKIDKVLIRNKPQKSDIQIRRKKSFASYIPFKVVFCLLFLIGTLYWSTGHIDDILKFIGRVEVSAMGSAGAKESESKDKSGKKNSNDTSKEAKNSSSKKLDNSLNAEEKNQWTEEEINIFSKLDNRKKELDERERNIEKLEAELQKKHLELEDRIKELERIREKIAAQLENKINIDKERVNKLVDFYSNMKPQNAAKIFENLEDQLAVEVLSEMKKKNAAEIMNLLEPKRAKSLSEMLAGYKRVPASR